MAGADGVQLRDVVTRWAASMARLFTGATPAAQLLVEEVASSGGGGTCNSLYRSVSTEDDEDAAGYEAADDQEQQLLAEDDGADPRRARSVCCERRLGDNDGARAVSWARELRRRPAASTGDASRYGDDDAAMEVAQSSEPLMLRRGTGERRGRDD